MIRFTKLEVWRRSHRLTLRVYDKTAMFPKEEIYGLTAQLRRSAAAIALNIAEGCGRGVSPGDVAHFAKIARGSVTESVAALLLAQDLGYLCEAEVKELLCELEEIRLMLNGFIRSVFRHDWH